MSHKGFMSWYRTYRPHSISGLHLTQVREQLLAYLSAGKLAQSWLFAGPRGTGKTSAARILAAIVNDPANRAVIQHRFLGGPQPASLQLQEPDQSQELTQRIRSGQALCVIELDAATHRGIDDVRELRERLMLPPPEGVMAVYILDEVHMFTTEAWNALLKILEEPPAHAMFVLATTELHKVPATIQSRCAVIRFQLATARELVGAFTQILKEEAVSFEPAGLEAVAIVAQGSFRDGVKLLEQLVVQGVPLTAAGVAQHPTLFQHTSWCERLRQAIVEKQAAAVIEVFAELRSLGLHPLDTHKTWVLWLHQRVVAAVKAERLNHTECKIDLFLLQEFLKVTAGGGDIVPFLELESKSLELVVKALEKGGTSGGATGQTASKGLQRRVTAAQTATSPPSEARVTPISQTGPRPAVVAAVEVVPVAQVVVSSTPETAPDVVAETSINRPDTIQAKPSEESLVPTPALSLEALTQFWPHFVKAVQARSTPVAALLHAAVPQLEGGGVIVLNVAYSLHQEKLMHLETRSWLEAVAQDIFGLPVAIRAAVAETAGQPVVAQGPVPGDNLEELVAAHVFT